MPKTPITGENSRWQMEPFNSHYTSSIFFSQDPISIDSMAAPPSGAVYYNGNGKIVTNLGVHEHWNNSTQKQYSRNLGKDEGIELIYLGP